VHKPEKTHSEIENALQRLMPVGLSEGALSEMELMLDDLDDGSELVVSRFPRYVRSVTAGGIAAAAALAVFLSFHQVESREIITNAPVEESAPELEYLAETDRVEGFSDEGLYVDTGGSAMRKMRVRLVEESQIRDVETGIVVVLTEPREEMYMVPVSTF
jgi:hypothetical protein